MRSALLTALLPLLVPTVVTAKDPDLRKVREAVLLPSLAYVQEFTLDPSKGMQLTSDRSNFEQKIATLKKEFKGDTSDIERYIQLRDIYDYFKQTQEAEKALDKAIELCRNELPKKPDDALLLTLLGGALCKAGKLEEAESILRRAAKLAPKDWRVWATLGNCVIGQSLSAMLDGQKLSAQEQNVADPTRLSPVLLRLAREGTIRRENAAKAEKLMAEAAGYFDEAVKQSPKQPEAYFYRVAWRMCHNDLQAASRLVRGEKTDAKSDQRCWSEIAEDFRSVARLRENDHRLIATVALIDLWLATPKLPSTRKVVFPPAPEQWKSTPEEAKVSFREAIKHLQEIADKSDKQTAASVCEVLAFLFMFTTETEETVRNFRRSIDLDPSRESAWDGLSSFLAANGQNDDRTSLCEKRLKRLDNSRNRLDLAKCYERTREYDKMEEQIRIGIRKDPSDFLINLAYTAVLLRNADNQKNLARAMEQIERTQGLLEKTASKDHVLDFGAYLGVYAALAGYPDKAQSVLQGVLKTDGDHNVAKNALKALEK